MVERLVRAAAATDDTVLISGEPGIGKALLARRIHSLSPRASGPFVELAIELESSLQLAHGGTLLVDAIEDLDGKRQATLQGYLQGRANQGVDRGRSRPNLRVVTTSHSDLADLVRQGRLSAGFVRSISRLRVNVPPLRDRHEDIPLLAQYFAREAAARVGRPAPVLSEFTCTLLASCPWPGNVRELREAVQQAVLLSAGHALESQLIGTGTGEPNEFLAGMPDLNLRAVLERLERQLVVEALRRAGGVSKEAAQLLGIRANNLGYFMRKHGISYASRPCSVRPQRGK